MKKLIQFSISILLYLLLLAYPLFFNPTTQEFYHTGKFYFLGFGLILLLVLATVQLVVTKKFVWRKSPFDIILFLLVTVYAASTLISSPNKIQALQNPTAGLGVMIFFVGLFFIASQIDNKHVRVTEFIIHPLRLAALVLSLLSIASLFNPLQQTKLPTTLEFLKSPAFSPLGSQLELAVFLGFFVIHGFTRILSARINADHREGRIISLLGTILITAGLLVTIYSVVSRPSQSLVVESQRLISQKKTITELDIQTPFSLSWLAAVETLKRPQTAVLGVGPDNFVAAFTKVKSPSYNRSLLWQVNFNRSRSALLQIWTETGLLGLAAIALLFLTALQQSVLIWRSKRLQSRAIVVSVIYLMGSMILFPPAPTTFFLFLLILVALTDQRFQTDNRPTQSLNIADTPPLFVGVLLVSLILIAGTTYLLGRSYMAEVHFKRSLDALPQNRANVIYENQRRAIQLNPYNESYRRSFSQLNLILANNFATQKEDELTDEERKRVVEAIQTAISEAKAAASLNPQRPSNWQNLGLIYRNIINAANGADAWAISSYEQAIITDPFNPNFRLSLGGVYYSLNNWRQAAQFFSQAVQLKDDWPNAHYNLAWALFQQGQYDGAIASMKRVLTLIDTQSEDFKKAAGELSQFEDAAKTQSASPQDDETDQTQTATEELNLPSQPQTVITPKLELPREASPGAE